MTTTKHHSNDNLVIFKVGPVPCCVDSQRVLAVIEPPAHITAIPGSNAFRPGLFSYQKRAVAVYDVRTKFSLSTEQRGKIMLAEINRQLFGFWVDQIQQIALTSQGRMQMLPTECPKELFESLFVLNDQLIFKTSFEALSKAQVSTRAQQFIQQYVKEKTEQRQSADEITGKISSQARSETKAKQQPLSAESKTAKPVKKSFSIDSVNTLKNTITSAAKTAPQQSSSIKSSPDSSLNQVTRTTEILTKSKAAIEVDKKDHQITTTNSEINSKFTSPVSPSRKQDDQSQKNTYRKSQNTNEKETDYSETPLTKAHATRSFDINRPTKSNKETSQSTLPLSKANTVEGKTVSPREPGTQKKHSFSTQTKVAAKETQLSHQDSNDGSNLVFAFVILILFLPMLYFGWDLVQTPETKPAFRPLKQEQKQYPVAVTDTEENNLESLPVETEPSFAINIDTETFSDISSNNAFESNLAVQPSRSVNSTDEVSEDLSAETEQAEPELNETYQADIEKHDDDITITLSGPAVELNLTAPDTDSTKLPETKIEQEDETSTIQPDSEEAIEKNTKSDISIEQTITAAKSSKKITPKEIKPASKKIIHIVVKGDTLWHIAKRYVRDPFKYSELARLSKIKNPDLIYPGNRVIIFIKNNK